MTDDNDSKQPTEPPEEGINDPLTHSEVEAPRTPFEGRPDPEE